MLGMYIHNMNSRRYTYGSIHKLYSRVSKGIYIYTINKSKATSSCLTSSTIVGTANKAIRHHHCYSVGA